MGERDAKKNRVHGWSGLPQLRFTGSRALASLRESQSLLKRLREEQSGYRDGGCSRLCAGGQQHPERGRAGHPTPRRTDLPPIVQRDDRPIRGQLRPAGSSSAHAPALVPSASATPSAVPSAAIGAAALGPERVGRRAGAATRQSRSQLAPGHDERVAHRERAALRADGPQPRRLAHEGPAGQRPHRVRRHQPTRTTGTSRPRSGETASPTRPARVHNATSYLVILGGWHNTLHASPASTSTATTGSRSPSTPTRTTRRSGRSTACQPYHFKIERNDGKTVTLVPSTASIIWRTSTPPRSLGMGHDHLAFNDWEAKVCFDNVKVTPLP